MRPETPEQEQEKSDTSDDDASRKCMQYKLISALLARKKALSVHQIHLFNFYAPGSARGSPSPPDRLHTVYMG